MKSSKKRFLWIDLEMTGLEVESDRILEVGVVVTDKFLNPQFEWVSAVKQDATVLENMNEWCQIHHRESGLVDRVPTGISEKELDKKLLEIIVDHMRKNKTHIVLCGNSIAQDRKFIDKYLPKFASRLHYRMLDVTALKVVFREFFGIEYKKQNTHQALDDIKESIAELRYYIEFLHPEKIPDLDNYLTKMNLTA